MPVFLTPIEERLLQRAHDAYLEHEVMYDVVAESPPQKGRAWAQAVHDLERKGYVTVHALCPMSKGRVLARVSITKAGRNAWLVRET